MGDEEEPVAAGVDDYDAVTAGPCLLLFFQLYLSTFHKIKIDRQFMVWEGNMRWADILKIGPYILFLMCVFTVWILCSVSLD